MILVYGDESMDSRKERVCTVAALIGTKEQWEALETAWTARTQGVPFHANDCDSDKGDYKHKEHRENKDLYRDLVIMLANSGIHGHAATLDLVAQARVFSGASPAHMNNQTYFQAFMAVTERVVGFAEHADEIAEMTFDSQIEIEHNAALLYANMRELNPGWQSRIASRLIFESSRINPRIQMADLFAREAMKAYDNEFGPTKRLPRKSWITLSDSGRFQGWAYGEDWFIGQRDDALAAPPHLQFGREDYLKWLGDRQDCTTAFIEYTKILFKSQYR